MMTDITSLCSQKKALEFRIRILHIYCYKCTNLTFSHEQNCNFTKIDLYMFVFMEFQFYNFEFMADI